jgi:hypothetical protein
MMMDKNNINSNASNQQRRILSHNKDDAKLYLTQINSNALLLLIAPVNGKLPMLLFLTSFVLAVFGAKHLAESVVITLFGLLLHTKIIYLYN